MADPSSFPSEYTGAVPPAFRLRLERGRARAIGAPGRAVLGIDETRAGRLFNALPRTIVLAGGDRVRDRAAGALARDGLVATAGDALEATPCARHRKLAATEVCPRCSERRACALCLFAEEEERCPVCAGKEAFWGRVRALRIALLLAVLAAVAWTTFGVQWQLHEWARPVTVAIAPIVVDRSPAVREYASSLDGTTFADVPAFIDQEAQRYGIALDHAVTLSVAPAFADDPPPSPPDSPARGAIALWSFQLRAWAFRMRHRHGLPAADSQIFVLYEGENGARELDRSLAVEKLRVGVVHAFSGDENRAWTELAIVHELLHTLGASDKYRANGFPVFPDGYAEPALDPRYPQRYCEIMAGQIATSEATFVQAAALSECLVGARTAAEIGWAKTEPGG